MTSPQPLGNVSKIFDFSCHREALYYDRWNFMAASPAIRPLSAVPNSELPIKHMCNVGPKTWSCYLCRAFDWHVIFVICLRFTGPTDPIFLEMAKKILLSQYMKLLTGARNIIFDPFLLKILFFLFILTRPTDPNSFHSSPVNRKINLVAP